MIKKLLFILLAAVVLDSVMIAAHALYYVFYLLDLWSLTGVIFLCLTFLVLISFVLLLTRWVRRVGFATADWFFAGCLSWLLLIIYFMDYPKDPTVDIQLHDTMFVIANYQVAFILGVLFGGIAIIYYLYPKIFRRQLRSMSGSIHFWLTLAGGFLLFHAGLMTRYGMPRRYVDIVGPSDIRSDMNNLYMFGELTALQSWTLILVLAAQMLFLINLVYSSVGRRKSSI